MIAFTLSKLKQAESKEKITISIILLIYWMPNKTCTITEIIRLLKLRFASYYAKYPN